MRLRRSDLSAPGYARRRRGSGFTYVDTGGRPLPAAEVERCKALVIPPAWRQVWISPDPAGHIQAVGVDAAGRKQYLYHQQWRARRDRRKFGHVRQVAGALPRLRRRIGADLGGSEPTRERVLALAARLLDRGLFRAGGDAYAMGEDPTFGVATLQSRHVSARGPRLAFCYPAKGGIEREVTVRDARAASLVSHLRRQRADDERLLAWRDSDGAWHEVRSADVNDYLRTASGTDMTAKDLRTWHATVLAAAALAVEEPPTSATAAKRVVARVVREVAEELGNTPTVARASYIDPVVIDRYLRGETIPASATRGGPGTDRAVLELLGD
jgi:DNA topoisomerase IB